jgi:hypothetical protein
MTASGHKRRGGSNFLCLLRSQKADLPMSDLRRFVRPTPNAFQDQRQTSRDKCAVARQRPNQRNDGGGKRACGGGLPSPRLPLLLLLSGGQYAPLAAQARIRAPNLAWVPGAGVRPAPGDHAHPTRLSSDTCLSNAATSLPPFRAGSLICSQIAPRGRPCHPIEAGARRHPGFPGTPAASKFAAW